MPNEIHPTPETLIIGPAIIRWTDARHGDQRASNKTEWMHVRQVHGNRVIIARDMQSAGVEADAMVTDTPGLGLGIQTADCGPIALIGDNGTVAAVHAGWKGLKQQIVGRVVESMRELGARDIQAALGPCIHVECYEFGPRQLDELVDRWGRSVRGLTSRGNAAFDLPAAVEAECMRAGVSVVYKSDMCTGCSDRHFSYRTQGTDKRQVMMVEIDRLLAP